MAPGSQPNAPTPVPIGAPAAPEWLVAGSIWQLLGPINLYSRQRGEGLASQAWAGRHLKVLEAAQPLGRQPRCGYACSTTAIRGGSSPTTSWAGRKPRPIPGQGRGIALPLSSGSMP